MIHYELNQQIFFHDECGEYVSYGVTLYRDKAVVRVIGDITPEKSHAEALVKLFNQEALSPVQLDEAIEDYLISLDI